MKPPPGKPQGWPIQQLWTAQRIRALSVMTRNASHFSSHDMANVINTDYPGEPVTSADVAACLRNNVVIAYGEVI